MSNLFIAMIELVIDGYGNKKLYNEVGQLHRIDGPAVEWAGGSKEWFQYGQHHRIDGPAVEHHDGEKRWYLNGKKLSFEEWLFTTQAPSYLKNNLLMKKV